MLSTQSAPADASPPRPWPADQLEHWPSERLIHYANNARLHSEADLDKIAAAILKWGWTMPVLVDEEGVLLAGEARVNAAAKLKLTSIPVIVARGWSEEENAPIAWPTTNWQRGRFGTSSGSVTSSGTSTLPVSTSA
jgi:hypothetical protein